MADPDRTPQEGQTDLSRRVGARAERKRRARREGRTSPWFGLGMFGLIGWSVAIPTLIGIALGLWLDERFPGVGVDGHLSCLGCKGKCKESFSE